MNKIEKEYSYGPRWSIILLCGFFFGFCTLVAGGKAATNDCGVIINKSIKLDPEEATIFYCVVCAIGVGFVTFSACQAYHRLVLRQRIALGPSAVMVPMSSWSSEEKEISYQDITGLSTALIRGQLFLYIVHPGGHLRLKP